VGELAHADACQLLFASDTTNDPEMAAMVHHVEDMLAEAIDPFIQADLDGDHPRLLAYAEVGMAEGVSLYVLTRPEQTLDDITATRLARRIGDLAWAGLRAVHQDRQRPRSAGDSHLLPARMPLDVDHSPVVDGTANFGACRTA